MAGVAAGAVIFGFVPTEIVARVAGPQNPLAIPVAAVVGAPLYIWPETVLPIGAALLEKGMGIGAIMALVIGGAGASIPEVSVTGERVQAKALSRLPGDHPDHSNGGRVYVQRAILMRHKIIF